MNQKNKPQQTWKSKTTKFVDPDADYRTQGLNGLSLLAGIITAACFFTPLSLWWLMLTLPVHYLGLSLEIHRIPKR